MSDEGFELVFVCDAETEEDEKVRHYYEGIQRLKDGKLPSSTQLFQSGRIFNKKSDPHLSVVGTKQLLNIRLKLEERKVWNSTLKTSIGHGASNSSIETLTAVLPDGLKSTGSLLSFVDDKQNRLESIKQLCAWSIQSKSQRVIMFGGAGYFTSLLGTPLVLRNCDVYRVSCSYTMEKTSLSFSNVRLLCRSDFSTHYPLNTIWSWKHILYSNSTGGGLSHSASDASLAEGECVSEKSGSVSLSYAHGFATSKEDINPVCRICQVSYFEMPNRRLIKPCKCSGTVKYVHKDCLNTWRATSPYAYTTCNMCHYHYKIRSPLISKFLVNEDLTFILAVLIMFPLCFLVGVAVHWLAVTSFALTSKVVEGEVMGLSSIQGRNFAQIFLNALSKMLLSPLDNLLVPSTVLQVSLLGCNMVGIAGFFATSNPYSLVSLSIVSYLALHYRALAVCCVIVGWGTALRELHLALMMSLRKVNSWIGNIIIESS